MRIVSYVQNKKLELLKISCAGGSGMEGLMRRLEEGAGEEEAGIGPPPGEPFSALLVSMVPEVTPSEEEVGGAGADPNAQPDYR